MIVVVFIVNVNPSVDSFYWLCYVNCTLETVISGNDECIFK